MKIVTVTLNPAIDITEYGNGEKFVSIGGKGINVSKSLAALSIKSIATGFIGDDENSEKILDTLEALGVETRFIKASGRVRENVKKILNDGSLTEFNNPGFTVTGEHFKSMVETVRNLAEDGDIFVFAGSVPKSGLCNEALDIYYRLVKTAKEKGAFCILDAAGEYLRKGLEAVPDVIKPNEDEAEALYGMLANEDKSKACARAYEGTNLGSKALKSAVDYEAFVKGLISKGLQLAVITLGADGAIFADRENCVKAASIPVKVCSVVGAGDAVVAGICYAKYHGMDFYETVKICMANGAGAVMSMGTEPAEYSKVMELKNKAEWFSL